MTSPSSPEATAALGAAERRLMSYIGITTLPDGPPRRAYERVMAEYERRGNAKESLRKLVVEPDESKAIAALLAMRSKVRDLAEESDDER